MPEEIPNDDEVSRLVDFPRMYDAEKHLIWGEVFAFPEGFGESVVWRRYAASVSEVHSLGCQREHHVRARKPLMRYAGCITATVGTIRSLRTVRGHGFSVEHKPEEGIHHAEVTYALAPGTALAGLKKGEKNELKLALQKVFGALVEHTCAEAASPAGG